jgi:hypothetical protein
MASYGKADPRVLRAFEVLMADRNKMMIDFRMERFREQAEKQRNVTCCKKVALKIRSLFILVCVAMVIGPQIYQIYEQEIQPLFSNEDLSTA